MGCTKGEGGRGGGKELRKGGGRKQRLASFRREAGRGQRLSGRRSEGNETETLTEAKAGIMRPRLKDSRKRNGSHSKMKSMTRIKK